MSEDKFNFTEAYKKIEEINEWFQQEDIDLEEGLGKYKRGLELIKKCREQLKEVENKLEEIRKESSLKESE